MIPKSHKIFKDGIAEEVGVHESVVDEFVSFYYKKVRDSLSSLEHTNVFIEGLGTFSLRKARVEKAIIKNKSFLGDLKKNTYKGYDKTVLINEKIAVLEKALNRIEESITLRNAFKNRKNGNK